MPKQQSIKPIKLTTAQKEEVRRLTQLANRRIGAAMRLYEKEGLSIAPYDVTGGIQQRSQWASEKYAISRSVKFNSQKAYKEHLAFLRSFGQKKNARPTITEYSEVQKKKLSQAIETVTMGELSDKIVKKINKLDSAKLSKFWNDFSEVAGRMAMDYSSEALLSFAADYFGEDVDQLADVG